MKTFKSSKTTRRQAMGMIGATAATAMLGVPRPARAADPGSIVVVSWGGKFQESQRVSMFEPFTKKTGIKIVEATGPSATKVAAMVQSGNVEWDVVYCDDPDTIVLSKAGMLEKLDYTRFDKTLMSEFDPHMVKPDAMPGTMYGYVIGWNTKKFNKDNHPKSWADVWDTKKFPGPRVMTAATFPSHPNEPAVMADGVPIDKVYPLDLERSYRMLEKIKPSVVKWTSAAAQAAQAIATGEADLGMAPHGTLVGLIRDGAPLAYDFNQGLCTSESWSIPKGSKNYDNAMKFIEFVSQAEQQANMCKILPFGPINKRSISLMTKEQASELVTYPENLKKQVVVNNEWWGSETAPGSHKTNVEKNIEMWNAFNRT